VTPEEEVEIGRSIRESIRLARGYADFFGWGPNRDLEESGVLISLAESLKKDNALFFGLARVRGRGNDPPDLEAPDSEGRRIGFEVTELVDSEAVHLFKKTGRYEPAEWSRERFLANLAHLLRTKDAKFPRLLEPPYEGGYVVIVFTDEPDLPATTVAMYLQDHRFTGLPNIARAYLVISYDPRVDRCPYFELPTGA